jgi:predicted regulator of Ras-like GTPase activity (Roadblock/LC7/MglB family)
MSAGQTTRQDELVKVLDAMAEELPDPEWVALVDHNGLVTACVQNNEETDSDRISAMTAVIVSMTDRILDELDGGRLRYSSISGSKRLYLTVMLSEELLLSVGLPPDVNVQTTFLPLRNWIPTLMQVLKRRFTNAS